MNLPPLNNIISSIPMISTPIQEGIDNNDYLECTNLDIDSEEALAYNVPLSSAALADSTKKNATYTVMQYIAYFMLFLFIFFTAPYAYDIIHTIYVFKQMFIGKKNNNPKSSIELKEDTIKVIGEITWGESFLFHIFFIPFIILVAVGAAKKQHNLLAAGIVMAIAYVIGFVSVKNANMLKDLRAATTTTK